VLHDTLCAGQRGVRSAQVSRSRRALVSLVIVAMAIAWMGPAQAAGAVKVAPQDLHGRLLTMLAATKASGTGYQAQSMGVQCGVAGPFGSNWCYQQYPHSYPARMGGAPWVTHMNIFSFPTATKARQYVALMAKRYPRAKRIGSSNTGLIGFDAKATISDGLRYEQGPEASVVLAIGAKALWVACGDPAGKAGQRQLVGCAQSVATAQARQLG
jgi:hypothetical protein